MISNYQPPQSRINQVLQVLPDRQERSLHAFVFGPQYDLFRYTNATERAAMTGVVFEENADPDPSTFQLLPYEGIKTTHIVDAGFVRVYAENLEGQVLTERSRPEVLGDGEVEADFPYEIRIPSLAEANKLRISRRGANITAAYDAYSGFLVTVVVNYGGTGYTPSSTFDVLIDGGSGSGAVARLTVNSSGIVASGIIISPGSGYAEDVTMDVVKDVDGVNVGEAGDDLLTELRGRPVQQGDVAYVTFDDDVVRRTVKRVEKDYLDAHFGVDSGALDKRFAASDVNPIQTSAAAFSNASAPANWSVLLARNSVLGATITDDGSGYTAPTLTIAAPTTVGGDLAWPTRQATGTVEINDVGEVTGITITDPGAGYYKGGVTSVTIVDGGQDYSSTPTVVVSDPPSGGHKAVIEAVVEGGIITSYKILDPGAGYTVAPTLTLSGGNGTDGDLTCTITAAPSLAIVDDDGSDATATAIIQSTPEDWNGLVEGSIYNNKYSDRYIITILKGGNGLVEARARIRSASSGFSADNIVVRHAGYGYLITSEALGGLAVELRYGTSGTQPLRAGDQFSFVITGKYRPLDLTSGEQLKSISIVSAGDDYDDGTYSLTITAPPAGGTQAAGTVTIASGSISAVSLTNPGAGYAYPPHITLPGGAGAGTEGVLAAVMATPETTRQLALLQGGVYTGPSDTQYILQVTKGVASSSEENPYTGATLRITDSAGLDAVQEIEDVQHDTVYDLGTFGLQFVLPGQDAAVTATATAAVNAGAITSVTITEQGAGYTSVPAIAVTGGGGGTGAILTAVVVDGKIVAITITNGGSGYVSVPTLAVAAPTTHQMGLRKGDRFYVSAVARTQEGASSIIVLNGQAVDITGWTEQDVLLNGLDVDMRVLFSGLLEPKRDQAPDLAYTIGTQEEGGVSLANDLAIQLTARDEDYQWVPVKNSTQGRLFVHWRGLVPATSADKITLRSDEDEITAACGVNDKDNPLAYGAIIAYKAGGNKPVFTANLATNDLAGFQARLNQAERVEGPYTLVPLTYDETVFNALDAHVTKASGPTVKLWRRGYICTKSPGTYSMLDEDSDGADVEASVLANADGNLRVLWNDGDFITRGVAAGDEFRTNYRLDEWGATVYDSYTVQTVMENDELLLETGPDAPITPAVKFEIWRPDTGASQASYVADISGRYQDRRIINIWSDTPGMNTGTDDYHVQELYYLACEYAGMRAAVLPQQGLSKVPLTYSLDDASTMFTKFTTEDLNVAAAGGTLIICQDFEDGDIYIRHQLTTQTNSGILYYEDSVGVIVDDLCYKFKDILEPYVGKRNGTPITLEELETRGRAVLDEARQEPAGLSKIGPEILGYENFRVRLDTTLRDRVRMGARVYIPLPINDLIFDLEAVQLPVQEGEEVTSISASLTIA